MCYTWRIKPKRSHSKYRFPEKLFALPAWGLKREIKETERLTAGTVAHSKG